MKKVIILGARGMLGQELGRVFYDQSPYLLDRDTLDITNDSAVARLVTNLQPDIVINAAAYTDVDGAEDNKELAMKVNGEAVGSLAEAAQASGAFFVHYSTDYVFSGKSREGLPRAQSRGLPRAKSREYAENDIPVNPVNVYGASKLLGEQLLRENTDKFYLIRTSWLFGRHGRNFSRVILDLAREGRNIKAVDDQHSKPTYARDLAERTRELIFGNYDYGIYHIVNEPAATRYDMAREIVSQTGANVKVEPVSSAEFPGRARRPEWSVLQNTKLPPLRPWKEAIKDYLKEIKF